MPGYRLRAIVNLFGEFVTVKPLTMMPGLILLVLLAASCAVAGGDSAGSKPLIGTLQARDFRAVARSMRDGRIVSGEPGRAWNYDTADEAARAAVAYCTEQLPAGPRLVRCEVVEVGGIPVRDRSQLDQLLNSYQERVLAELRLALSRTGQRELVTQLSTILQKIGRYAESEELLKGLAQGGEILARNALAYHWAELRIHPQQALAYAESAVADDPAFFSYRDTLGLVLTRLGRMEEAEDSLAKAVELQAHPIALDHYGDILWLRDKKEAARVQWGRAVEASRDILFIQRVSRKIRTGKTGDIVFE